MMCTVVRKLGRELEPAAYPAGVNFVCRVLVKTDTGVEARADIPDWLYELTGYGTRMRWSWGVRPKGAARLLAPVITWIGRRREQAIWAGMKRYLEPRNLGS